MKNSKLLLILLPIAALLFWYLGRPPSTEHSTDPSIESPSIRPAQPPQPTTSSVPATVLPPVIEIPTTTKIQNPATGTGNKVGQINSTVGDVEQRSPAIAPVTGNPEIAPEQKIEALRLIFRNYASRHKGNPVGNNAEITAALLGQNPGSANYLADGTHGLNDKNELCDGWGTPYFFHQLSGTEMEIRSAGPDKKIWTTDDLVIK